MSTTEDKLKPPPNKKRRIDTIKPPQFAVVFPKEILIYILTFLRYSKGIVFFSKTCKFIHQFVNNNPSCIKHYRFGAYEYCVDRNKLLNEIQKFIHIMNNTNNSNITRFFQKFSQLESLELHSMDAALFHLLGIELDPAAVNILSHYMLKPLQNKLIRLIVQTHDDSALSTNSFNFDNIKFQNVTSLIIHGKDSRYPFHITDYTPNVEQLTLVGLGVFPYSLFRMLFDTNKRMQHLLEFRAAMIGIVAAIVPLVFYDSKLQKISRHVPVYDISELHVNKNGGQLQLIDFQWGHSSEGRAATGNFVLVMILYNQVSLRRLRVNYEIFYKLDLKQYNMKDWNGMKEFMQKYNGKKTIDLPQLEYLSISMVRLASKTYKRLNYDLLCYKLKAPKLHSIEIRPGLMCWHNSNGFIPFLEALIGDQLHKLQNIKIINADKSDKKQQQYLESSIDSVRQMFKRKKQSICIEY